MPDTLDGLVTFYASHHAIRAEKVLQDAGYEALLVPGPKELSPNCGTALRFIWQEHDAVLATLDERSVEIDEAMEYVPVTESFPRRSLLRRRPS